MMMKTITMNIWGAIFLLTVFAACREQGKTKSGEQNNEQSVVQEKPQTIEEQLTEIMQLWPGTFNNDKQITEAEAKGENIWRLDDSGKDGWLQLQSHYIKLNALEIGANVLYVEEYRDHQPDATYRQRIYTLSIDSTATIRVKMWPFKDKKKYIGAWKTPEVLKGLKADEISAYPDKCDLLVEKIDGEYHMKMNGKDCAFGDRVFNYQVILKENTFSYRDKITTLNDSLITTAASFAYHNLDRIQQ